MNRAIFKFSFFQKFTHWLDWFILAAIALGPSVVLVLVLFEVEDVSYRRNIAGNLYSNFNDSNLLMLLTYVFVSDGLVNRKAIGDVAPLSLVFTRPISRASYVFSKWMAGLLGAMLILIPSAIVFQITARCMGVSETFVDGYSILEMVLNSVSYSALMVLLHSLPGAFGPLTYLTLIGITNIGNMVASYNNKDIPWFWMQVCDAAILISFWFGDFTYPAIDVFTILTSVAFDWNQVVIYASNIVIYLGLATVILSRREFFYATE